MFSLPHSDNLPINLPTVDERELEVLAHVHEG